MSVPVWNIRGSWSAEETRRCRLALLLLMERPSPTDPLRMSATQRIERDLPCSRHAAMETTRLLRTAGFLLPDGRVTDAVQRPFPAPADTDLPVLRRAERGIVRGLAAEFGKGEQIQHGARDTFTIIVPTGSRGGSPFGPVCHVVVTQEPPTP